MIQIGIFAQQAAGQAAAATGTGSFMQSGTFQILMMVGVFVIFYLLLIMPESKRRKQLQKDIAAIKTGDKVITTGGVYGVVDFISEKTIYIKSLDSKFEIAKESVAGVIKNK